MYELNNKIRLMMYPDIRLKMQMNSSVLYVVLYSQDHDLQEMYLDSFLKNAKLEGKDITDALSSVKRYFRGI